jgi:hypothetical protein
MNIRTKQDAARVLANVEGDKRFFCEDGCVSGNLTELVNCLTHMSEEIFSHHVTSWKNDFSNWVRDVFGDNELASDLAKITNASEAAKIVKQRVTWLQKKLR